MMNRKVLPFVLVAVVILVFVFANSWGNRKSEPSSRFEKILTIVGDLLEQGHFSPKKLDDDFSKQVFDSYLKAIDGDKSFFLKSNIAELKKFETQVDNEIRTGKTELIPAVDKIFNDRIAIVEGFYKEILSQPFDFSKPEKLQLDSDKREYATTDKELKEYWRKRLKFMVLERYAESIETREKNKDSANFEIKDDVTLEKEARDRVKNIWDRNFNRIKRRLTLDEKFNMYVNAISETMDPHTQFFPPVERRAFDEAMSGSFFGIGAQLTEQDGNVKIANVVSGTPAWKSGEIHVNDIILKVGQGAEEPVDITGFETQDAVKLIRGKKDTEVRLTLRKTDGTIKVVSLIREKIELEETLVRSAIIQKDNKIGYIFLPEFYANFEDPNGHRSGRDVANEIKKLKAENIDGLVIDLRYNGGGSLQDVIQMVGLFIEDGPVVQVKDKDGDASVYRDRDKTVLYDGPLVVMINEYSASASEIFAAAIQDYGRGIVVGSPSYGKGTVQRQVGLDPNGGFFSQNAELGSLKLTLQKFYRINGGSTQLKGVTPNIILPDNFEFTKNRERDQPNALPWDEIAKSPYSPWHNGNDISAIEKEFQPKIDNDPTFKQIRDNAKWLSERSNDEVLLTLSDYKQTQQKIRALVKQNDSLQTLKQPMDIKFVVTDEDRISQMDKDKAERFRLWLKNLTTDIYISETSSILNDIIVNGRLARK
ncbi:MAG: carboxy terminal-processing peptidase [Chitinophagaceae bacterium]|nr:carboxy terminal-processing peptidase [Chitinophagaceae bacterium]